MIHRIRAVLSLQTTRLPDSDQLMRLDKWLWAARFFKTRQLAVEAINGGKVHLNGNRCKPGKDIEPGSQLRIHKGPYEWQITVLELPRQRRPASEAINFYTEAEESREKREKLAEQMRLQREAQPLMTSSRPNKKDRRLIHRFKNRNSL
jgi:ribosome-associated heat shock protein Hsp15